jgi:phospholipid/cholesterol/gamma-HCH transport system permease protein
MSGRCDSGGIRITPSPPQGCRWIMSIRIIILLTRIFLMNAKNAQPRIVQLPVSLDRKWVEKCTLVNEKAVAQLVLDFSKTEHVDSAGMALVYYLNIRYEKAKEKLVLKNLPDALLESLNKWKPSLEEPRGPQSGKYGFFAKLGASALSSLDTVLHALSMLTEILYWGTFGLLKRRDFRRGVCAEQMYLLGYKALGIVCLLAFLIGIVLALQAAIQLNRFGAGIFLAPMIGVSMIKELGPLLTAIILSGRNGSATTAEIATMSVNEEIDALKTMGLNPVQFVVVPKLWAMTLTMPLLTVCATVVGISGGYVVAVLYLEIAPSLFIGELLKNIILNDVIANVVKSTVFSWLIVWIGAFHGFRVTGGPEDVGRETTASVVTGIFIIIVMDSLFSFVF